MELKQILDIVPLAVKRSAEGRLWIVKQYIFCQPKTFTYLIDSQVLLGALVCQYKGF